MSSIKVFKFGWIEDVSSVSDVGEVELGSFFNPTSRKDEWGQSLVAWVTMDGVGKCILVLPAAEE